MTAEQKLEKCKELVETLRKDADAYREFGYATVASTFNRRAKELQAVLEETPLTQVGEVFKDVPDEEMKKAVEEWNDPK